MFSFPDFHLFFEAIKGRHQQHKNRVEGWAAGALLFKTVYIRVASSYGTCVSSDRGDATGAHRRRHWSPRPKLRGWEVHCGCSVGSEVALEALVVVSGLSVRIGRKLYDFAVVFYLFRPKP